MFFFYVDETGNRDPRLEIPQRDGSTKPGDPLYVLTAINLFESRWHGFEKTINRFKRRLADQVYRKSGQRLDLADCEIKSNWVRVPKERAAHPLLSHLGDAELQQLVELYYRQLEYHHMSVFSVIIDKRHLHDYMDQEKIHRKSWELLLELVEQFMRVRHDKHQALMINDDISKQVNRSLAMKHAYILEEGTRNGTWLKHVCEMPMFVRSELSNGVQLADLCSYNIYRAFREGTLDYLFFKRITGQVWSRITPCTAPFSGLRVFPDDSPLRELVEKFENERASVITDQGP